jgi:hypothetical protein
MAGYFCILHTDWNCRSNSVVSLCTSLSENNITIPVFAVKVPRVSWNTRDNCKPGSYIICLSQYSDGLRAERPGFDSRQEQKVFFFSIAIKLTLGPTQTTIKWVPGAISLGVNRPVLKMPAHIRLVPRSRIVELYLHALIRFYGMMLNWLRTCTILPLSYYTLNVTTSK